jgi:hypothetical protein
LGLFAARRCRLAESSSLGTGIAGAATQRLPTKDNVQIFTTPNATAAVTALPQTLFDLTPFAANQIKSQWHNTQQQQPKCAPYLNLPPQ